MDRSLEERRNFYSLMLALTTGTLAIIFHFLFSQKILISSQVIKYCLVILVILLSGSTLVGLLALSSWIKIHDEKRKGKSYESFIKTFEILGLIQFWIALLGFICLLTLFIFRLFSS